MLKRNNNSKLNNYESLANKAIDLKKMVIDYKMKNLKKNLM